MVVCLLSSRIDRATSAQSRYSWYVTANVKSLTIASCSAQSNMSLQEENERLKRRIEELERKNSILEKKKSHDLVWPLPPVENLSNAEIKRFGRQLILPDIGITGQKKLRNTSMLVVGAGGLGSPICLYLGGAGVGRIGIVDHDEVDVSNLHRQVIHNENRVGVNKAQSAAESIRRFVS
jgi:adenylyltransferase/sulfurtransferase